MDALPYIDSLLKEYLLFRGFTQTLSAFQKELEADKGCGFQAERITDQIFRILIPALACKDLWEFLDFLDAWLYSRLDTKFGMSVRKMELSVLRYYLVRAVRANRLDKVQEFFRLLGDTLLSGPDADTWRPWFSLAFVRNPAKDPSFQSYFAADWGAALQLSFRNFIAEVLRNLPLPALLRFNTDRLLRLQLQQQIDSLQHELERLKREQHAPPVHTPATPPHPPQPPPSTGAPTTPSSAPPPSTSSPSTAPSHASPPTAVDPPRNTTTTTTIAATSIPNPTPSTARQKAPSLTVHIDPFPPDSSPQPSPDPSRPAHSTFPPSTAGITAPGKHKREASLVDWTTDLSGLPPLPTTTSPVTARPSPTSADGLRPQRGSSDSALSPSSTGATAPDQGEREPGAGGGGSSREVPGGGSEGAGARREEGGMGGGREGGRGERGRGKGIQAQYAILDSFVKGSGGGVAGGEGPFGRSADRPLPPSRHSSRSSLTDQAPLSTSPSTPTALSPPNPPAFFPPPPLHHPQAMPPSRVPPPPPPPPPPRSSTRTSHARLDPPASPSRPPLIQATTSATFASHTTPITCCSFSPTAQNVASASSDGMVHIWSPPPSSPPGTFREVTLACGASVTSLAWDRRADKVMLLGTSGRGVKAWHADSRRMVAELPAKPLLPEVLALCCSPLEPVFACSQCSSAPASPQSRGRLSLWNMRAFKRTQVFSVPGDPALASLVYSRSGTLLAAGTGNGQILLFDPSARSTPIRQWAPLPAAPHPTFVTLRDAPSGPVLISIAAGVLQEWSLAMLSSTLPTSSSASGPASAASSVRALVRTIDLAAYCCDSASTTHAGCHAASVSPSGRYLAAASSTGLVPIVDLEVGGVIGALQPAGFPAGRAVTEVQWHPREPASLLCGGISGALSLMQLHL